MIVKFSGGAQIENALREMDITKGRKRGIATKALANAAQPIRDEWRRRVDKEEGDLERSIKISPRADAAAKRAARRGSEDVVTQFIGIDPSEDSKGRLLVYAYVEEFGVENRPANPAGRQAWEARKMEAFNRLADDLRVEIDKVAKREARKAR